MITHSSLVSQQNHEDKAVMRPLYTRYRTLKQLLARGDAKASFNKYCKTVLICSMKSFNYSY